MLKKRLLIMATALSVGVGWMLITPTSVQAGFLDSVPLIGGGGKKESGEKVDANALANKGNLLILTVKTALIQSSLGAEEIMKAAGLKEEADKKRAFIDRVEKNDPISNPDGFKKLIVADADAGSKTNIDSTLKSIDVKSKTAKKHVGKSALYWGSAIYLDTEVVGKIPGVIEELTNGVQQMASSLDISGADKLKGGLAMLTFLAESTPKQINDMGQSFGSLTRFMANNKLALPSKEEQKKHGDNAKKNGFK